MKKLPCPAVCKLAYIITYTCTLLFIIATTCTGIRNDRINLLKSNLCSIILIQMLEGQLCYSTYRYQYSIKTWRDKYFCQFQFNFNLSRNLYWDMSFMLRKKRCMFNSSIIKLWKGSYKKRWLKSNYIFCIFYTSASKFSVSTKLLNSTYFTVTLFHIFPTTSCFTVIKFCISQLQVSTFIIELTEEFTSLNKLFSQLFSHNSGHDCKSLVYKSSQYVYKKNYNIFFLYDEKYTPLKDRQTIY